MKAAVIHEFGDVNVRKYEDIETPKSKRGHVLIKVLAAGASGSGSMLIQVAKALGAAVATTIRNDAKANFAKQAGADLVINARTEDVVERVKECTGDHRTGCRAGRRFGFCDRPPGGDKPSRTRLGRRDACNLARRGDFHCGDRIVMKIVDAWLGSIQVASIWNAPF